MFHVETNAIDSGQWWYDYNSKERSDIFNGNSHTQRIKLLVLFMPLMVTNLCQKLCLTEEMKTVPIMLYSMFNFKEREQSFMKVFRIFREPSKTGLSKSCWLWSDGPFGLALQWPQAFQVRLFQMSTFAWQPRAVPKEGKIRVVNLQREWSGTDALTI